MQTCTLFAEKKPTHVAWGLHLTMIMAGFAGARWWGSRCNSTVVGSQIPDPSKEPISPAKSGLVNNVQSVLSNHRRHCDSTKGF
jgi:hypothetical protein